MNSNFFKVLEGAKKAIIDMETFTESNNHDGFVYRYGFVTSQSVDGKEEGAVIAWFHADSEGQLENKIKKMDRRFFKYTDARVQREYDPSNKTWYATYVVCFPFDEVEPEKRLDWQLEHPLF